MKTNYEKLNIYQLALDFRVTIFKYVIAEDSKRTAYDEVYKSLVSIISKISCKRPAIELKKSYQDFVRLIISLKMNGSISEYFCKDILEKTQKIKWFLDRY